MVVPSTNLYADSPATPEKTMSDVEKLLEKFNITEKRFNDSPDGKNTFLEFIVRQENKPSLKIRIMAPFIEKAVGRGQDKIVEYDKPRSYRFFYHYLKALLSAKEAEMRSIEEIFMAHIVVSTVGGELTLGEQMSITMSRGDMPALAGFNIVSTEQSLGGEQGVVGQESELLNMLKSDG